MLDQIIRWVILVRSLRTLLTEGAIRDSANSKDETKDKIKAFRNAGIKVLDHIGYVGEEMAELLRKFKARQNRGE